MPTPRAEANQKNKTAQKSAPTDAIKLLTTDHREVEALFRKFEQSDEDNSEKADIVAQICEALIAHAEIEEEIFYPAAREALSEDGEDLLDEAEVEHDSIKYLIEQLQDAESGEELYDAKVKVLMEYVKHHVKEEEGEIFLEVKKTDLDLDQLGAQLLERKAGQMSAADEGEEDNPE